MLGMSVLPPSPPSDGWKLIYLSSLHEDSQALVLSSRAFSLSSTKLVNRMFSYGLGPLIQMLFYSSQQWLSGQMPLCLTRQIYTLDY
jgi:hypothetical protein